MRRARAGQTFPQGPLEETQGRAVGRAMRHGRSPIDGRGPKGPVVSLARRAKREVTRGPVLPGRPTEVVGASPERALPPRRRLEGRHGRR